MGTGSLCRKGKRLLHGPARDVPAGSSEALRLRGSAQRLRLSPYPAGGGCRGSPCPGRVSLSRTRRTSGAPPPPHGSTARLPCAPRSRCVVPEQRSGQSGPERRAARHKVACIEVVEAYVERIKEVNPLINAVVKDRFEEALQEARQVDKLLSEGPADDCLEEKFPLLGVPITVKEAFSLYGMPNTSGLVNRRNVIATSDATVVSRLKQAGAIPLGVTNCSELCMWYESSNRVYGRTNNPYDLQRIVGGSSGGEGCVLAAACSVVGVGSDIGGSIRMPAFFNGVFGHKPTTGVVPNDGQFPDAYGVRTSYLCTGPMCRYAEDLEPVLRVMAGPGVSNRTLAAGTALPTTHVLPGASSHGQTDSSPFTVRSFPSPHHGRFSSFSSWSVQSSATMLHASEGQSGDGADGAALLFATACTQLLSPLPLCFFLGSCAIPALAAARVCSHKVLLEK
ncbi:fatty-acid amide hydrolase 2 isoform X4 [Pyrgilauda ruficollis]|uniref:fatty-acid amide hydrolase 2 isoform X4 n=1 Tax=Pyrgilauda ruficollis TaxID=221976 RepID=UPI001B870088|nr:fatty-acid amide hydrolase 2 isoform X4 [Pyrgilauda ruficollis]